MWLVCVICVCVFAGLLDLLLSNLFLRCGLGCWGWMGAGAGLSCCLCVWCLVCPLSFGASLPFCLGLCLCLLLPLFIFGAVLVAFCGLCLCLLAALATFVCLRQILHSHRGHFGSRYTLGCCGHAGDSCPSIKLGRGDMISPDAFYPSFFDMLCGPPHAAQAGARPSGGRLASCARGKACAAHACALVRDLLACALAFDLLVAGLLLCLLACQHPFLGYG